MESFFEILTVLILDAASAVLIFVILKADTLPKSAYSFSAAAMALGFLIGTVGKRLLDENYPVMLLFALGFMLSYTAFVFTFPQRSKRPHESR